MGFNSGFKVLTYLTFTVWSREHSKGNKTVPGKVAKTRTDNGHK